MTHSILSEAQLEAILNELEAGTPTHDLCVQHRMSEETLSRWMAMRRDGARARTLLGLAAENRKLKQMVADKDLDIRTLRALIGRA
jgi:putative transposase